MKNVVEKKMYQSPKMEIVEMPCLANLLQSSDGYGSDSFGIFCTDCDDSENPDAD